MGVFVVVTTTLLICWATAGLCFVAGYGNLLISIVAFTFLALAAWTFTTFGEWLWAFEGGWYDLQRKLRIIQITALGSGCFWCVTFRIAHSLGIKVTCDYF